MAPAMHAEHPPQPSQKTFALEPSLHLALVAVVRSMTESADHPPDLRDSKASLEHRMFAHSLMPIAEEDGDAAEVCKSAPVIVENLWLGQPRAPQFNNASHEAQASRKGVVLKNKPFLRRAQAARDPVQEPGKSEVGTVQKDVAGADLTERIRC